MDRNGLDKKTQFGYKKFHSTETMVLNLTEEVLKGFDEGLATVVLFFAFDTIDIMKLLDILLDEIGLRDKALEWFRSKSQN